MTELENARARSNRKSLNHSMVVESNTLGCMLHYPLVSENISKSGLLLTWESPYKTPFQINTLLEMTIDTKGRYLKGPLSCLGKIVRKFNDEQGTEMYGIRIIQIDPKDQYIWEGMVQDLEDQEQQSPQFVTN